jgi:hypothetical protein
MKEIIHRLWIITQDIRCPLLKPKACHQPEHEQQMGFRNVLDIVGNNPNWVWDRVKELTHFHLGALNASWVVIKTGCDRVLQLCFRGKVVGEGYFVIFCDLGGDSSLVW